MKAYLHEQIKLILRNTLFLDWYSFYHAVNVLCWLKCTAYEYVPVHLSTAVQCRISAKSQYEQIKYIEIPSCQPYYSYSTRYSYSG